MANKYFGVQRQFLAKGVYSAAINPPNNFTVPTVAGFATTIVDIDQESIDPDTNVILTEVGLFSNFADGLVLGQACQRLLLGFTARAFRDDPTVGDLQGAVTINTCSKAVTGAGAAFDTELADGDYFAVGSWVYKVDGNPAGANLMNIAYWPPQNHSGSTGTKLQQVGTQTFRRVEITDLNMMVPVNEFLTPALFSSTAVTKMAIEVSFLQGVDLIFLTKSIDTSYADDPCFFDVRLGIEYTKR